MQHKLNYDCSQSESYESFEDAFIALYSKAVNDITNPGFSEKILNTSIESEGKKYYKNEILFRAYCKGILTKDGRVINPEMIVKKFKKINI